MTTAKMNTLRTRFPTINERNMKTSNNAVLSLIKMTLKQLSIALPVWFWTCPNYLFYIQFKTLHQRSSFYLNQFLDLRMSSVT